MEYFKYKAQTDFLDSGKLTGDLVSAVSGISERKKVASAEVQKSFDDVQTELNSWQSTKTQNLNELAIRGVDEIRVKSKELADKYNSGAMSAADYKVAMTALKQTWGAWAKGAQNYDAQLQALIERQNSGEGGEAEAANIRYFAEYSNLANKSWSVQNDGNILLVEKDKNGNVVRFDDSKFIFNPGNNVAVKVDLDKDLDKDISYWQTWKLKQTKADGTSYSLEDLRQNPAFQDAAVSLQNKFTATPQQTASVLADNGDHQIAINDAEANRFLDEMVSKEQQRREYVGMAPMTEEAIKEFKQSSTNKIIVMKRDKTGQMIPDITPEQLKAARKIVNDKIEINLGRVEEENKVSLMDKAAATKASKYAPSRRSGSGTQPQATYSTYAALKKSWDTRDPGFVNSLMNANGYNAKWNGKSFDIYSVEPEEINGVATGATTETKIGTATQPAQLSPYMYKDGVKNTSQAMQQFTAEQTEFRNKEGDPGEYRYVKDANGNIVLKKQNKTSKPKPKAKGNNTKPKFN